MDKSLLVAVFTPTTDAAGTDFGGKRGELATGYPVGKDLILTARHVLEPAPPDRRNPRYPIKIRWDSYKNSGWIKAEEIVWRGPGELDAALIRCSKRPPEARGWGVVSAEKPRDGMQWKSVGFPRAAKYDHVRDPRPFDGKVRTISDENPLFELTEEAPPATDEDWQGASGMPVFVGGKILGVVRSVPRNFNAKRLDAIGAWKLLQDQDFRNAIGYEAQVARAAAVKNKLVKTLKPSPIAVEALSERLGSAATLVGLKPEERVEHVAERLLASDIGDAIRALRQAHRALSEEEPAEQDERAAERIAMAAQLIVPAIYDYGVIQTTRSQRDDGVALALPPAGLKTVAEIIMAGVDGRKTRFHCRRYQEDYPEGELSLPYPPECGIATATTGREDVGNHLARKFCLAEGAQEIRLEIDSKLAERFYRPAPGEPRRTPEQRIMAINNSLKRRQDDEGVTFYMVFYLPNDEAEKNAVLSLIENLKKDYSALMFLGLSRDSDQTERDKSLVYPLCCMLPLTSGERAGERGT